MSMLQAIVEAHADRQGQSDFPGQSDELLQLLTDLLVDGFQHKRNPVILQQDAKDSIWWGLLKLTPATNFFTRAVLREAIDVVLALTRCRSQELQQVFDAK